MTRPLQPGDRVKYSAEFLRSAGLFTGAAAYRRGTVREVIQGRHDARPYVTVAWDDHLKDEEPAPVNPGSLHLVGTPEPA